MSTLLMMPATKIWLFRPGYLQGAFWAIMIGVVSSSNDVMMCHLGNRLHWLEIVFFRFVLSALLLLPLLLQRPQLFKTKQLNMHVRRGVIGAIALALCCLSVNSMPLSQNTAVMFTEPLFFLPMAFFLLKEKVDRNRWFATCFGFLGLMIILNPGVNGFDMLAFIPIAAAILFAYLCVMAKNMIATEHTLTLLFYFGIIAGIVTLPFVPNIWVTPTSRELMWLMLLGFGSSMIQYCLFKAYSATDASALAPFRYVEFIVASLFGFVFFGQIPTLTVVIGAVIISFSAFYLSYIEIRKEKNA